MDPRKLGQHLAGASRRRNPESMLFNYNNRVLNIEMIQALRDHCRADVGEALTRGVDSSDFALDVMMELVRSTYLKNPRLGVFVVDSPFGVTVLQEAARNVIARYGGSGTAATKAAPATNRNLSTVIYQPNTDLTNPDLATVLRDYFPAECARALAHGRDLTQFMFDVAEKLETQGWVYRDDRMHRYRADVAINGYNLQGVAQLVVAGYAMDKPAKAAKPAAAGHPWANDETIAVQKGLYVGVTLRPVLEDAGLLPAPGWLRPMKEMLRAGGFTNADSTVVRGIPRRVLYEYAVQLGATPTAPAALTMSQQLSQAVFGGGRSRAAAPAAPAAPALTPELLERLPQRIRDSLNSWYGRRVVGSDQAVSAGSTVREMTLERLMKAFDSSYVLADNPVYENLKTLLRQVGILNFQNIATYTITFTDIFLALVLLDEIDINGVVSTVPRDQRPAIAWGTFQNTNNPTDYMKGMVIAKLYAAAAPAPAAPAPAAAPAALPHINPDSPDWHEQAKRALEVIFQGTPAYFQTESRDYAYAKLNSDQVPGVPRLYAELCILNSGRWRAYGEVGFNEVLNEKFDSPDEAMARLGEFVSAQLGRPIPAAAPAKAAGPKGFVRQDDPSKYPRRPIGVDHNVSAPYRFTLISPTCLAPVAFHCRGDYAGDRTYGMAPQNNQEYCISYQDSQRDLNGLIRQHMSPGISNSYGDKGKGLGQAQYFSGPLMVATYDPGCPGVYSLKVPGPMVSADPYCYRTPEANAAWQRMENKGLLAVVDERIPKTLVKRGSARELYEDRYSAALGDNNLPAGYRITKITPEQVTLTVEAPTSSLRASGKNLQPTSVKVDPEEIEIELHSQIRNATVQELYRQTILDLGILLHAEPSLLQKILDPRVYKKREGVPFVPAPEIFGPTGKSQGLDLFACSKDDVFKYVTFCSEHYGEINQTDYIYAVADQLDKNPSSPIDGAGLLYHFGLKRQNPRPKSKRRNPEVKRGKDLIAFLSSDWGD